MLNRLIFRMLNRLIFISGGDGIIGAGVFQEVLLHVLMLPDFERADRIGEFW